MPRKTIAPPAGPPATPGGFNEAAARCRGKPQAARPLVPVRLQASMRPRPDAAENRAARAGSCPAAGRFNEAAARCRGKPDGTGGRLDVTLARLQ